VLQYVAACSSVLQSVPHDVSSRITLSEVLNTVSAEFCSVAQCVAVCRSVLQCVAVCSTCHNSAQTAAL